MHFEVPISGRRRPWPQMHPWTRSTAFRRTDKRATTNVQHRFVTVLFIIFSSLLFSLDTTNPVRNLAKRESSRAGKNAENVSKKCVPKIAGNSILRSFRKVAQSLIFRNFVANLQQLRSVECVGASNAFSRCPSFMPSSEPILSECTPWQMQL